MSALPIDRAMMTTFIGALFRYADEGTFISIRAFLDDRDGTWGAERWPAVKLNGVGLESVSDVAAAFAQTCADADEPVVFAPPVATFNSSTGAAEKDIANGIALSVECDQAALAACALLEQILGRATVVVASGGEWMCPVTGRVEPKLHIHWRLQEPTRQFRDHQWLKEARRLAQQLAGTDGSAVPLVHPLRWPGSWHRKGEPRLARILALNDDAEIDLGDALERLREAVAARGDDIREADYATHEASDPAASIFDVFAALGVIPNYDLHWDQWNRIAMATWAATGGSEAGFHAFDAWSRKSAKYDRAATRERWHHISKYPPDRIGFGTLAHLAKEARRGWRKPSADFVAPPSGDPFMDYANRNRPGGAPRPDEEDFNDTGTTSARPRPTIFDAGLDDAPIPPRGWLLGTAFCRKMLSSLLGGGGSGKTTVRIAQALVMATGRPLTGEHVFVRSRVLFICLEDDIDELRRRVTAAMLHYEISKEDLQGWLFYAAPGRAGGKLLERSNNQLKLGWMAEWLVEDIERLKIDAVIIDPLVKAHSAIENSNDEMDAVSDVLAQIAHLHDCAVDTPHHLRKGPTEAGNADQGRGAGAMKDGARLVYTLATMSEGEAKCFDIPLGERRRFMRVDHGKVNLAPAVEARWFELVGVRIGNQSETYPHGDEIQVALPWTPPDTWAGLSNTALNEALTEIDEGIAVEGATERVYYSAAPAAKQRAAWKVVQKYCPDRNEAQCREIIRTWVKTGTLIEKEYMDVIRREAAVGVRVDSSKRPGTVHG